MHNTDVKIGMKVQLVGVVVDQTPGSAMEFEVEVGNDLLTVYASDMEPAAPERAPRFRPGDRVEVNIAKDGAGPLWAPGKVAMSEDAASACVYDVEDHPVAEVDRDTDADFITHARDDILWLLAMVVSLAQKDGGRGRSTSCSQS